MGLDSTAPQWSCQCAHTTPARRFGRWLENTFMSGFPPYAILKSLDE
jgi:hypothetical protein